jgi:hypothetical protein
MDRAAAGRSPLRGVRVHGGDAERVGLDHEVAVRIERLAGPGQKALRVPIAAQPVDRQDGVAAVSVERAVSDVRHPEVRNDGSALKREVAELAGLDRRGLRRGRKTSNGSRNQDQTGTQAEPQGLMAKPDGDVLLRRFI